MMLRTCVLAVVIATAASFPNHADAQKEEPYKEFPKLLVGKWKFVRGANAFGIFIGETEFTKDGKILQPDPTAKTKMVEIGTYRVEKDELVVTMPKAAKDDTFKILSISDEKLVSTTPEGELKRVK
jgi:uncharacterized protein (TIGR03066 family)